MNQFIAQITGLWKRITPVQRIVVGVATIIGIALIGAYVWWASSPDYAVAFTGLSEADAGAIVEKLKTQAIPYRLRDAGTVLVPAAQVYDVRLSMAKDGVPAGSTVGFELFNTNSFGLTEFSQKVNYQRALEGELARTIESIGTVKAARVHIVVPAQTLYTDQQKPTTASITMQLKPGKQLDAGQVQAITHLVASSIEGLKPQNVVIVDSSGQLLSAGFKSENDLGFGLSDDQRVAQRKYETLIENKVQDILTQVLGPNKSIVRVTAYLNWDQSETTAKTFSAPVLRSSSVISETYSGSGAVPGGIPGASSNLPGGAPSYQTTITNTTGTNYVRSETTNNYEVNGAQTRTVIAPGQIKKLSVSVMVDNVTDEKIKTALTNVVTLAAGIDATRGDQVALQSIQFDRSYFKQQTADIASQQQQDLYAQIGIWIALGIVILVLLWFTQRVLNNLKLRAGQDVWTPLIGEPTAQQALQSAATAAAALRPPAATNALTASAEEKVKAPPSYQNITIAATQSMPPEIERMQKVIIRTVEQRPAITAQVIRLWLEEDGQTK